MVLQTYALYPHLKVYDNLAFGLKVRGVPRDEIQQRVRAVAAQLAILPLLDKKPRELSGGERQRVALGRAMVRQPQDFLEAHPGLSPFLSQPVILGVRPEHLGPAQALPSQVELRLTGAVDVVETLGPVNQVHLALTDPRSSGDRQVSVTATLDTAVQVTLGAGLEIACDLSRLHFFQPADGQRL